MAELNIGNVWAALRIDGSKAKGDAEKAGAVAGASIKKSMGIAAGLAAGAFLGAITGSISSARDWQSAFAGVRKTLDLTGLSAEDAAKELGKIEKGLRDMAKRMPISAVALAGLAEQAGALGIAREDILSFVETAALIGTTTDVSAEAAANALGKINSVIPMTTDEMRTLADTLVSLGNSGASTESQILSMAQGMAGTAAQIGLSETAMLGWASSLANIGEDAEAGSSSFSRFAANVDKIVVTGGAKLESLGAIVGQTGDQFATSFRDDASGALESIILGLAGMDEKAQLAALSLLGINDIRIRRAILGLISNTDNLTSSLDNAESAAREGGAATREAAQRWATLDSKVALAQAALNDVAITLGTHLLPILTDLAVQFSGVVNGISDFLSANPDLVGQLTPLLTVLSGLVALNFGAKILSSLLPLGGMGKVFMAGVGLAKVAIAAAGALAGGIFAGGEAAGGAATGMLGSIKSGLRLGLPAIARSAIGALGVLSIPVALNMALKDRGVNSKDDYTGDLGLPKLGLTGDDESKIYLVEARIELGKLRDELGLTEEQFETLAGRVADAMYQSSLDASGSLTQAAKHATDVIPDVVEAWRTGGKTSGEAYAIGVLGGIKSSAEGAVAATKPVYRGFLEEAIANGEAIEAATKPLYRGFLEEAIANGEAIETATKGTVETLIAEWNKLGDEDFNAQDDLLRASADTVREHWDMLPPTLQSVARAMGITAMEVENTSRSISTSTQDTVATLIAEFDRLKSDVNSFQMEDFLFDNKRALIDSWADLPVAFQDAARIYGISAGEIGAQSTAVAADVSGSVASIIAEWNKLGKNDLAEQDDLIIASIDTIRAHWDELPPSLRSVASAMGYSGDSIAKTTGFVSEAVEANAVILTDAWHNTATAMGYLSDSIAKSAGSTSEAVEANAVILTGAGTQMGAAVKSGADMVVDGFRYMKREASDLVRSFDVSLSALTGITKGSLRSARDAAQKGMEDIAWSLKHPLAGAKLEEFYDDQVRKGTRAMNRALADGNASAYAKAKAFVDDYKAKLNELRLEEFHVKVQMDFVTKMGSIPGLGSYSTRAHGGPVDAGTPYWVGEQGPELFWPNRSGDITSAPQSAAISASGGWSSRLEILVRDPDAGLARSGISGDGLARQLGEVLREFHVERSLPVEVLG